VRHAENDSRAAEQSVPSCVALVLLVACCE
jgi:hypothetical protein